MQHLKYLILQQKLKQEYNISYRRMKEQDLDNFSFIFDVYSFLIKDFKPFFE